MSEPRIASVDGEVCAVVPVGSAKIIAAHLGRLLAARPTDAPPDRVLVPFKRLLELAETAAEVTQTELRSSDDGMLYLTPTEAGRRLGISRAAVAKRCRLGQIPGAQQIESRWRVPSDAVPDEENHDNRAA